MCSVGFQFIADLGLVSVLNSHAVTVSGIFVGF